MDVNATLDLLKQLFEYADLGKREVVCFFHPAGAKPKQAFHTLSWLLQGSHLETVLSDFPEYDTYMTFNTFVKKKKPSTEEKNLFNIYNFCLDIDYKKGKNKDCSVKEAMAAFWLFCENTGFPRPSFIEYGNQFRLIYRISGHLSGTTQTDALRLVEKAMVSALNRYKEFDFQAETQNLSSYLRVPGSKNGKESERTTGSWVENNGEYVYRTGNCPVIQIINMSGTPRTLGEYMEEFLPDFEKPEWYDAWKEKAPGKEKKASRHGGKINENRLHDIDLLQAHYMSMGEEEGNRNNLCFQHYVHAKLLYTGNSEKAYQSLLSFNEKFKNPMFEKELNNTISSAKRKIYKYSGKRLLDFFGLEKEEAEVLGLSFAGCAKKDPEANKKACKKYQEKKRAALKKAGKTKKQKLKKAKKKVCELHRKGVKTKNIAKSLKVSESSVERYISELIKDGKLMRKKLRKACEKLLLEKQSPSTENSQSGDFFTSAKDFCEMYKKVSTDRLLSNLNWFGNLYDRWTLAESAMVSAGAKTKNEKKERIIYDV